LDRPGRPLPPERVRKKRKTKTFILIKTQPAVRGGPGLGDLQARLGKNAGGRIVIGRVFS